MSPRFKKAYAIMNWVKLLREILIQAVNSYNKMNLSSRRLRYSRRLLPMILYDWLMYRTQLTPQLKISQTRVMDTVSRHTDGRVALRNLSLWKYLQTALMDKAECWNYSSLIQDWGVNLITAYLQMEFRVKPTSRKQFILRSDHGLLDILRRKSGRQ